MLLCRNIMLIHIYHRYQTRKGVLHSLIQTTNHYLKMSGFYDTLCNMLIRPARQSYSDYDLGPPALGSYALRENFTFTSSQNHIIRASFYKQRIPTTNVCVLYLHSFNGSRLQPLSFIPEVVKRGFHFCSMDFAGCGNSGGEYVSLGYHERWDALRALQQIRDRWGVKEMIVWGRSMGAVTGVKLYALLLQQQGEGRLAGLKIVGMVLDSAFVSLKRMVVEVAQARINVPEFLIKALFLMVGSSIEERANFKVAQLELGPDLQKIRCPVLLLASKQDTFVSHLHSEQIFSKLPLHEHKQLQYTSGQHYEQRNSHTILTILKFIEQKYRLLAQSPRQLRVSYLRQQGSLQKPSRSLRKYEPRRQGDNEVAQEQRIHRPCSGQRGQAIKFTNLICHQFVSVGSEKRIQTGEGLKQYHTQKKIEGPGPQIKITIGREMKGKDCLRSKSKPNFSGKIINTVSYPRGDGSSQNGQDCEQENHFNIISGKLRKRGRTNKEEIDFSKQRGDAQHINVIKFEESKNQYHYTSEKHHKLSMTAQQYKNAQVKILKGVIHLSPSAKKKTKPRGWEQSKSMSNLNQASEASLTAHLRSSTKFELLQRMEPCSTVRRTDQ